MSGRGTDSKPAATQVGGDGVGELVGARRHPADVQDARRGVALLHDDAGLEVGCGQHHGDGVGPLEQPQRRPLVGDRVLRAHHRHVQRRVRDQVVQGGGGVLGLHGQQHHRVVGPLDLGRGVGGRRVHDVPPGVGVEDQTPLADARQVVAAGDEGDRAPGPMQVAADDPADRSGPVDDVAHGPRSELDRLVRAPGQVRRDGGARQQQREPDDLEHHQVGREPGDDQPDAGRAGRRRPWCGTASWSGCCPGTEPGRSWPDTLDRCRVHGPGRAGRRGVAGRHRAASRRVDHRVRRRQRRQRGGGAGAARPSGAAGDRVRGGPARRDGRRAPRARRAWRWRPIRVRSSGRRPRWRRSAPTARRRTRSTWTGGSTRSPTSRSRWPCTSCSLGAVLEPGADGRPRAADAGCGSTRRSPTTSTPGPR